MEKQAEVLKCNPSHLKACILYEVLQKKPVYDSYLSFCKIIGDSVMDYVDFEYWFYRFYNGNCDFDCDRSQEPKKKALVELPAEILTMITEEVDPMDRVFFSTVCKIIKGVCDITSTKFEHIKVVLFNDHLDLYFDDTTIKYYSRVGESSKLKINDGPERDIKSDFLSAGQRAVNRALNMPNIQIEHFTFDDYTRYSEFSSGFPLDLHVKSVEFRTSQPSNINTTMAFLKTRTLEKIKLYSYESANLDIFLESKHFAEAKEVNVKGFALVTTMIQLEKFSHLEKFEVTFDKITPEIVTGIRDMLSASKSFKSCVIASRFESVAALIQSIGEIVPGGVGSVTHRTNIQGTRDFLNFNIVEREIWVEKVRFEF